jgi:hypothetical protein
MGELNVTLQRKTHDINPSPGFCELGQLQAALLLCLQHSQGEASPGSPQGELAATQLFISSVIRDCGILSQG